MFVLEAYTTSKNKYPTRKTGKSEFTQPQSPLALFISQLSQNVCICKYHTTFILLIDTLHQNDWTLPRHDESFISAVVCDKAEEECWNHLWPQCKNSQCFKDLYPLNEQGEYIDQTDSKGVVVAVGVAGRWRCQKNIRKGIRTRFPTGVVWMAYQ